MGSIAGTAGFRSQPSHPTPLPPNIIFSTGLRQPATANRGRFFSLDSRLLSVQQDQSILFAPWPDQAAGIAGITPRMACRRRLRRRPWDKYPSPKRKISWGSRPRLFDVAAPRLFYAIAKLTLRARIDFSNRLLQAAEPLGRFGQRLKSAERGPVEDFGADLLGVDELQYVVERLALHVLRPAEDLGRGGHQRGGL